MGSKERGIPFSTELVPRVLDGSKTQTRRIMTPQPTAKRIYDEQNWRCPYGVPGDRLWIKETWQVYDLDYKEDPMGGVGQASEPLEGSMRKEPMLPHFLAHKADGIEEGPWRSGRFMPKWAARPQRLEIVRVCAERVQDISEDDVEAEGIGLARWNCEPDEEGWPQTAGFAELWDKLNGKRAPWASNPWVWVIEFKCNRGCVTAERR